LFFFLKFLGIEFKIKIIEADDKRVKLQVWDTAGQERFRTLHRGYYRNTHGIILCYAINNRESFEQIEFWMEEIRQYASKDVCIALVGNKCDLPDERVVSTEEGRQKAEALGIKFFETSAKEDINIEEAYSSVTRDINKVFRNELSEIQRLRDQENNSQGKTECFKCS